MADEQELRIVATLDDRASAGLAQLQRNMREMGSGPQAQGMQAFQEKAAEAGEATQNLGSQLTSFAGIAGTMVPLALAGMAASFVATSITQFAQNMTTLGQEAYRTGLSVGQLKVTLDALKTAGITEEQALGVIRNVQKAQDELQDLGSGLRQSILQATPEADQEMMKRWLDDVMVQPTTTALRSIQEMGPRIRRGAAAEARAAGEAMKLQGKDLEDYVSERAAAAEQHFYSRFGADVVAHVTKPIRDATAAEEEAGKRRAELGREFTQETQRLGEAWSKVKGETTGAMLPLATDAVKFLADDIDSLRDPLRAFQNMWSNTVEITKQWLPENIRRFLEDPPTELRVMWYNIKEDIANLIPDSVRNFISSPSEAMLRLWNRISDTVDDLIPESVKTFIESPSQAMLTLWTNVKTTIANLIPESVRNFVEEPSQALLRMWDNISDTIQDLIPESVSNFFANPPGALLRLWNDIQDTIQDLIPDIDSIKAMMASLIPESVRNFFENPGEGLLNLVNRVKEALLNLIPGPLKKWIGMEEGGATATPGSGAEQGSTTDQQPASVAPQVAPHPAFGEAFEAFQSTAPAPAPAPAAVSTPQVQEALSALSAMSTLQYGGQAASGRPYVVGEQGPEVMVPQQSGTVQPMKEPWEYGIHGILHAQHGDVGQQISTVAPYLIQAAGFLGGYGIPHLAETVDTMLTVQERLAEGQTGAEALTDPKLWAALVRSQIPGMGLLQAMNEATEEERGQFRSALHIPGEEETPIGSFREWIESIPSESRADPLSYFAERLVGGAGGAGRTQAFESFGERFGALADDAAQQVNVSGTGKISVDVRAPPGTNVTANGEGLFKQTEISRQTQMLLADTGGAAFTGLNAGDIGI